MIPLFRGLQSFPAACTSFAAGSSPPLLLLPSSVALPNQGKDLDITVTTPALLVNAVQL